MFKSKQFERHNVNGESGAKTNGIFTHQIFGDILLNQIHVGTRCSPIHLLQEIGSKIHSFARKIQSWN